RELASLRRRGLRPDERPPSRISRHAGQPTHCDHETEARSGDGGLLCRGARACAQLSAGAIDALEHDEDKPCGEAALALDVSPSRVTRAQVFGTGAKV